MSWRQDYFSFRGRVGRKACWLYVAISTPLLVALVLVSWTYAWSVPGAYENGGPTPFPSGMIGMAGAVLFFSVLAALLVVGLAVTVKRLHDRNKAWWWIAVFIIIPDGLYGLAQYLDESGSATNESAVFLVRFAATAFAAWGLIELGFLRGTAGANRFGSDPLAAS